MAKPRGVFRRGFIQRGGEIEEMADVLIRNDLTGLLEEQRATDEDRICSAEREPLQAAIESQEPVAKQALPIGIEITQLVEDESVVRWLAEEGADEARFLQTMEGRVAMLAHQAQGFEEQDEVEEELSKRRTDGHVANERQRVLHPEDAHAGHREILAEREGQEIDPEPQLRQHLNSMTDTNGRASPLEEGLRCNDQNGGTMIGSHVGEALALVIGVVFAWYGQPSKTEEAYHDARLPVLDSRVCPA